MTEPARGSAGAPPAPEGRYPLPFAEFITLLALLMAMTALSIDIMLPSLPEIGRTFGVAEANDRQMVVTSYFVGLAVGQLFYGPLSDRYGRKPLLAVGLGIYLVGGIGALIADAFPHLLAARTTQGFGSAAARILGVAIVRDLFAGRQMARVLSMAMTVFIVVPVFAPAVGQAIAAFGGWRSCFYFLLLIGLVATAWSQLRLPETRRALAPGEERPSLMRAFLMTVGSRVTLGYGTALGLVFGCLIAYISSAQQVFVDVFDLGDKFPIAFGSVALTMAAASFTNSQLVQRLGMRRVGHTAVCAFLVITLAMVLVSISGRPPFPVFIALLAAAFFVFGLIQSNFNAIAMQPLGAIAGMASSFIGFYTSLISATAGFVVARLFDGTVLPLSVGFFVLSGLAFLTVLAVEGPRGLFRGE